MERTKSEKDDLQQNIDAMDAELSQVRDEIAEVTRQNDQVSGELRSDLLAKHELEQLITETETSFNKINESIKTLICVVQKQEKHLIVKTQSK